MKKLLSLLALLSLALAGFAQETEYFIIRKKNSAIDLYKVTATRDVSTYPSNDQGYESFRQAVSNGLVVRYTEDGCPIAIGVRAPLTKPTCATVISVAYNQTFQAEAATGGGAVYDKPGADGNQIKDGELTYSVSSIPAPGSYTITLTYQSNSSPPTANVSVNGGSSTSIPLNATGGVLSTVSATVPGFTTGTNSVKITPNGYFASDKIVVSRAGSTTVTDPGSGTTTNPGSTTGLLAFQHGYFWGNSFNRVGVIPNSQWTAERGMAASDLAHDYCHVLEAALKTKNPNFSAYVTAGGSVFEGSYLGNQYPYSNYITGDLNYNFSNAPPQFDLLVLSIGENMNEATFNKTEFFAGLDQVISTVPKSTTYTVVLRSSFWGGHTTSSAALQEYATLHNYKFVNFSDRIDYPAYQATTDPLGVPYSDAGIRAHWNNAGHAEIAARIAAQLTGTTSTTQPGGGTGGQIATNGGYGNIWGPNTNYVELNETTRPNASDQFPRSFLTNSIGAQIAVNTQVGSVVDLLSYPDASSGKNLVNSPVWGNGKTDAGRQLMWSWYANPSGAYDPAHPDQTEGHYEEAGQSTAQMHPPGSGSIGYNPVMGGDAGQNPTYGITQKHHNDGSTIYIKSQGLQWDMIGIFAKAYTENWISKDPTSNRAFRIHARLSLFRDDPWASKFPTPRQQEAPCLYQVVDYRDIYYCAGTPYTNAPLTNYPINSEGIQQPILTSEPFILAKNPMNGRCLVLMMYTSRWTAGKFNNEGFTTSTSVQFPSYYISATPQLSLDPNGVYDFDSAVGEFANESDARAWVNNQPHWDGHPQFVFNTPSRRGFLYHNCKDQLESNIVNKLVITPMFNNENNGKDMNIGPPEVWIDATSNKHIYIKGAFTTTTNTMWLRYRKAGPGNSQEYYKEFTLPNTTGQAGVVDIDMSGDANWSGNVASVAISHRSPYPDVTNEKWEIYYWSFGTHLGN
jgi:hypothetical protein